MISKETADRIQAIMDGDIEHGYVLDIIIALKEDMEKRGKA